MILRSISDHWRIRFFPIVWREDDQISNVKMFRQAFRVLNIALEYLFRRKNFLLKDRKFRPARRDLRRVDRVDRRHDLALPDA